VILFPLKIALKVMTALLAVIVVYLAVTASQIWLTSRKQSSLPADAVIVLGSAQYDGVPSPDLQARLDQAAATFTSGQSRLIAVSGGRFAGDRFSEAEVSASYLEAHHIPASAIVQGGGADTYQNVSSVAPQLKARGVTSVLVVTDPFHEARSMAIASTFGFTPRPDPTATSPITGWATVPFFAKETLAVAAGRIIGYGRLSGVSHPGG
jgi:uncharacterized SAM-binding protein YcdF (DUF218 family)